MIQGGQNFHELKKIAGRKRIIINEDPEEFGPRNYSWDPVHGNASNCATRKLGTEVK
jgi:hypothetical protein